MPDYIDELLGRYDPTYGGAVNEQGLVSLQNMFPSENPAPVFLSGLPPSIYPGPQDRLGEDVEGAGTTGILPNVQEMEIQSWFAANPDATAQEIFDVMQANNISPEAVISAMNLDPESAMATYNTFLNPAPAQVPPTQPAPVEPSPTDESVLEQVLGGTKDVVTAVGGVIDRGLQTVGQITGMGDPSLVVLNPTNPTATVVYGTPQGNATPTIIGNMPRSGAPIGVLTGIPGLDDIIAGVFSQRGQGSRDIKDVIKDVVLAQIGNETGYPVAGVAGAVQGGLSGDLDQIVDSVSKVVLQIDKAVEEQDKVDQFEPAPTGITGPAPGPEMGPTTEELLSQVQGEPAEELPATITGPAPGPEMGPTLEELLGEPTAPTIPTAPTTPGVTPADLDAALDTIAGNLGTTREQLETAIAGSETRLGGRLDELLADGATRDAAIADLAGQLGTTRESLEGAISGLGQQITGQIGDVQTELEGRIAELTAQGQSQAAAQQQALQEYAAATGRSIEDLRGTLTGQIGGIAEQLSDLSNMTLGEFEQLKTEIRDIAEQQNTSEEEIIRSIIEGDETLKASVGDIEELINQLSSDRKTDRDALDSLVKEIEQQREQYKTDQEQYKADREFYALQQLLGQSGRQEKTEKAGLADIGEQFDLGQFSLADILQTLGSGDTSPSAAYDARSVDEAELLRILRG